MVDSSHRRLTMLTKTLVSLAAGATLLTGIALANDWLQDIVSVLHTMLSA
jgi:hypothetical protein